MINFRDSVQRQGDAYVENVGWTSGNGKYQINAVFELPVTFSKSSTVTGGQIVRKRSPLDHINTGAEGPQGNKPCNHFTISGDVELQPLDGDITLSSYVDCDFINLDGIDDRCIVSFDPSRYDPYWSDTADPICIISAGEIRLAKRFGYDSIFSLDFGGITYKAHENRLRQAAGCGTHTWVLFALADTSLTATDDVWPTLYWSRVIAYRDDGAVVTESGMYTCNHKTGRGSGTIVVQCRSIDRNGRVMSRGWTPRDGWTKGGGYSYSVSTRTVQEGHQALASHGASLSRVSSTPTLLWLGENMCRNADCNAYVNAGQASAWSDIRIDDTMDAICAHVIRTQAARTNTFDIRALHDDIMDRVPYFNGNMLAYVRDVRDVLGTAVAIARFVEDPSVANLSSAWLGTRYGTRLTVADTKEIVSGVERAALDSIKSKTAKILGAEEFGWEKLRARHTESQEVEVNGCYIQLSTLYNSSCQYRRDDLGSLLNATRTLIEWDAIPDAQNIWDLIPYSFVVDWIVDVESIMNGIDRRLESAYYHILAVVDSVKTTYRITELPQVKTYDTNLIVSLDVRDYSRSVSQTLTFTPFRISSGHLASKNVLDGAALIAGRT